LPIRFARWARMIVARSHKGHFTTKT
jgi:hypothetical protein